MSEIGDKTFILVTIYAAKMKWWKILFVSSIGMCVMHSLSVGLGRIFVLFLPKIATEIIAIALFWLMGTHAIYRSVKEYRSRYLRKKAGKKETESSDSDERAEIEEMIAEHEAEVLGVPVKENVSNSQLVANVEQKN